MTNQAPTQAITYIAIDKELVESLRQTLEATRLELERLRQHQAGTQPMSMKEAAAYLKIARSTLSQYISRSQITPSTYGSRMWVTRNDLDAFLARHRRKP